MFKKLLVLGMLFVVALLINSCSNKVEKYDEYPGKSNFIYEYKDIELAKITYTGEDLGEDWKMTFKADENIITLDNITLKHGNINIIDRLIFSGPIQSEKYPMNMIVDGEEKDIFLPNDKFNSSIPLSGGSSSVSSSLTTGFSYIISITPNRTSANLEFEFKFKVRKIEKED